MNEKIFEYDNRSVRFKVRNLIKTFVNKDIYFLSYLVFENNYIYINPRTPELFSKTTNFQRPNNHLEIEKKINGIIIWGVESPKDLFNLIKSSGFDPNIRKAIGLIIISAARYYDFRENVVGCFKLLRSYDEKFFNSFGKESLGLIGLRPKRWFDIL